MHAVVKNFCADARLSAQGHLTETAKLRAGEVRRSDFLSEMPPGELHMGSCTAQALAQAVQAARQQPPTRETYGVFPLIETSHRLSRSAACASAATSSKGTRLLSRHPKLVTGLDQYGNPFRYGN